MGSNYLTEVLGSEDCHLANISSKIAELVSHANSLKADVRAVAEHNSIHFSPLLKENDNLISKSNNLLKEMASVEEQMDREIKNELSSCDEELKTLSTSLKEVKLFLQILEELLEINNLLMEARKKMEKKEFYECAKSVTDLKVLIKGNSEKLRSVEIFKILSQEITLTYEQLSYIITDIWSQCIQISAKDDLEKNVSEINISLNNYSSSDFSQILNASHVLKSSLIEKKFSQALLNDVLKVVILKKSQISTRTDSDKAVLKIQVFNDSSDPNYSEVFDNLKLIIDFLKSHLDIEMQDGSNFMSKIGSHISGEFSDYLIKNCLAETIPTSSDDLEKYKFVAESAEVFEKTLQGTGFLPRGSSSLMDYAKNVNVLFANKFCQSFLNKARIIIKKDLHNVTTCEEVTSNINVLPLKHRRILKEKLNIQDNIFLFPKCQISKQAEELMTLVHSMMKEIEKSSDLCAVRLFFTVRNIFEMYSAVVPLHHKKFLETLPYHVALLHNNCMYFTHSLINLVTNYYGNIPCILDENFNMYLEEAIVLRTLAAETLEVTVTNQRNQLIFLLRDSVSEKNLGFATLHQKPKLDPKSEKSLRQCIRTLQVLQNVWSNVLPSNVYSRAMGFLLDTIVEELIRLIIAVEDISSQTANDLASTFTIVLEKGPNLFLDPREVHRHSVKFFKFQEFVLVLKGSLKDIEGRWAGGAGPLANEFTAEQVKHLIRALFQNSERRAALLAKIRQRQHYFRLYEDTKRSWFRCRPKLQNTQEMCGHFDNERFKAPEFQDYMQLSMSNRNNFNSECVTWTDVP